jgi:glutaredoxin
MITKYGAPWCAWCEKAKALADQYHLPITYINVDIGANKDRLKQAISAEKYDLPLTIPCIWWDTRYIGGYQQFATEIENTLGNYGQGPC